MERSDGGEGEGMQQSEFRSSALEMAGSSSGSNSNQDRENRGPDNGVGADVHVLKTVEFENGDRAHDEADEGFFMRWVHRLLIPKLDLLLDLSAQGQTALNAGIILYYLYTDTGSCKSSKYIYATVKGVWCGYYDYGYSYCSEVSIPRSQATDQCKPEAVNLNQLRAAMIGFIVLNQLCFTAATVLRHTNIHRKLSQTACGILSWIISVTAILASVLKILLILYIPGMKMKFKCPRHRDELSLSETQNLFRGDDDEILQVDGTSSAVCLQKYISRNLSDSPGNDCAVDPANNMCEIMYDCKERCSIKPSSEVYVLSCTFLLSGLYMCHIIKRWKHERLRANERKTFGGSGGGGSPAEKNPIRRSVENSTWSEEPHPGQKSNELGVLNENKDASAATLSEIENLLKKQSERVEMKRQAASVRKSRLQFRLIRDFSGLAKLVVTYTSLVSMCGFNGKNLISCRDWSAKKKWGDYIENDDENGEYIEASQMARLHSPTTGVQDDYWLNADDADFRFDPSVWTVEGSLVKDCCQPSAIFARSHMYGIMVLGALVVLISVFISLLGQFICFAHQASRITKVSLCLLAFLFLSIPCILGGMHGLRVPYTCYLYTDDEHGAERGFKYLCSSTYATAHYMRTYSTSDLYCKYIRCREGRCSYKIPYSVWLLVASIMLSFAFVLGLALDYYNRAMLLTKAMGTREHKQKIERWKPSAEWSPFS